MAQGTSTSGYATCQGFLEILAWRKVQVIRLWSLPKAPATSGSTCAACCLLPGLLNSEARNWNDTRAGLQTFWAGLNDPFHGYDFYVELATLAEDAERWHLAHLLWREAVAMIERTPDRLFAAAAHYYLAVAAMRVRDLTEADSEFRIASQRFAALPDHQLVACIKNRI